MSERRACRIVSQARTYETAAASVDPSLALFTAPLGIVKTLLS